MDEQTARLRLEQLKIPFTEKSYLETAKKGQVGIVALFTRAGMPVDASEDMWNVTALMLAAEKGHKLVIQWLLSAGADVNAQTYESETALMRAAENGHFEIFELLIKAGADVRIESHFGWTALACAASGNHLKMAERLISLGSNLDRRAGGIGGYVCTPVERAALCGDFEMLKLLIGAGAKLSGEHLRPLEMAATGGHPEIIKYLLAKGVDVNERSDKVHRDERSERLPALAAAASNGHLEIVKFLLAHGADVNLKSRYTFQTALMQAARYGHSEIFKVLIEAGAELDGEDSEGWTALMRARMFTKRHPESDILDQFPDPNPNLTGLTFRLGFFWNQSLLPLCPTCILPMLTDRRYERDKPLFYCQIEGEYYPVLDDQGNPIELEQAQVIVGEDLIDYFYNFEKNPEDLL